MRIIAIALLNSRMDLEKQRLWAEISHEILLSYIQEAHVSTSPQRYGGNVNVMASLVPERQHPEGCATI